MFRAIATFFSRWWALWRGHQPQLLDLRRRLERTPPQLDGTANPSGPIAESIPAARLDPIRTGPQTAVKPALAKPEPVAEAAKSPPLMLRRKKVSRERTQEGSAQDAASAEVAESLRAISADPAKLRIRMALAEPRNSLAPRPESTNASGGAPAIIGLDFGTAYTKSVVQWQARHYVVDWSKIVNLSTPALLPSGFSEKHDGTLKLGACAIAGWTHFSGLKARLMSVVRNDGPGRETVEENATIFIALALGYIRQWLERETSRQKRAVASWRINIGLPAAPWKDAALRRTLQRITGVAWSVAATRKSFSREDIRAALASSTQADASVEVIAEFAAQLASYLQSPQREEDLHAMVDVGAGTVDFVTFNAHWDGRKDVLPIASSLVEPLGVHHLLGVRAGKRGESLEWSDADVDRPFQFFAERVCEPSEKVSERDALFRKTFAGRLGVLFNGAHQWYPESRRWKGSLPTFFCGGGIHVPTYRSILESFTGCRLDLRDLPTPPSIVGEELVNGFHRVSVAYGLSLLPRNIGAVMETSIDSAGNTVRKGVELADRDADR